MNWSRLSAAAVIFLIWVRVATPFPIEYGTPDGTLLHFELYLVIILCLGVAFGGHKDERE